MLSKTCLFHKVGVNKHKPSFEQNKEENTKKSILAHSRPEEGENARMGNRRLSPVMVRASSSMRNAFAPHGD